MGSKLSSALSNRILTRAVAIMFIVSGVGLAVWLWDDLLFPPPPPASPLITSDPRLGLVDEGNTETDSSYEWNLPPHFPVPMVPDDNPMSAAKVELGRSLFYDTRLSENQTMSCASCHVQALAFTDGKALAVGSTGEVHPRSSMSLTNVAYNATFTWANPALTTLEQQIPVPLFGEFPVEMGLAGHEQELVTRLESDTDYPAMFAAAFPDDAAPVSVGNVTKALAAFNRTLISGNSPYDQYLQGDKTTLSESAQRGMNLFFGERLECHHCHTGFNMSLSTVTANTTFPERPFFNTGLYNVDGKGSYPPNNTGVFAITNKPEDMGRFRPPSLRNVALTAPYMHDGSIETLEAVIDFYENGGRNVESGEYQGDGRESPYKSGFIPGFTLTNQERTDLVTFLESLTDNTFITDPRFSNPFPTTEETTATSDSSN